MTGKFPTPIKRSSRISFGVEWYATLEEAEAISRIVSQRETVNGGWRHGEPCGREPSFDMVIDGKMAYAVIRA